MAPKLEYPLSLVNSVMLGLGREDIIHDQPLAIQVSCDWHYILLLYTRSHKAHGSGSLMMNPWLGKKQRMTLMLTFSKRIFGNSS